MFEVVLEKAENVAKPARLPAAPRIAHVSRSCLYLLTVCPFAAGSGAGLIHRTGSQHRPVSAHSASPGWGRRGRTTLRVMAARGGAGAPLAGARVVAARARRALRAAGGVRRAPRRLGRGRRGAPGAGARARVPRRDRDRARAPARGAAERRRARRRRLGAPRRGDLRRRRPLRRRAAAPLRGAPAREPRQLPAGAPRARVRSGAARALARALARAARALRRRPLPRGRRRPRQRGRVALHLLDLGFALWASRCSSSASAPSTAGRSRARAAAVALAVALLPVLALVAWLL